MFIRIALNESSLVDYMNALRFNTELTSYVIFLCFLTQRKYYFEYAIMRNEEFYSTFMMLLDSFANVHFRLFLKVKTIDQEEYWHDLSLLYHFLHSIIIFQVIGRFRFFI